MLEPLRHYRAVIGVAATGALVIGILGQVQSCNARRGTLHEGNAQTFKEQADESQTKALGEKAQADAANGVVQGLDGRRKNLATAPEALRVRVANLPLPEILPVDSHQLVDTLALVDLQAQEIEVQKDQVGHLGTAFEASQQAFANERQRAEALQQAVTEAHKEAMAQKWKTRFVIGGVAVGAAGLLYLFRR